jgi:hypothetical protein
MSKISYCSLEEAWGQSCTINNKNNNEMTIDQKIDKKQNLNIDSSYINENQQINKKNIENNKLYTRNRYNYLENNGDEQRKEIINNMNNIERNNNIENNSIIEYQKYRFNPINKVNNNNNETEYSPFNESIEKKYLQDKLNFLENEFRKYKNYFENEKNNNNYIENFSNKTENDNENTYNRSNDIIDLILLIIIGLIVIFVMNSIFNIGKSIGLRNRSI